MTGVYRAPTKRQVEKAMADLGTLAVRTPRERLEHRYELAKAAYTRACQASLNNEPGAAGMADVALREIDRAKAALAAFDAEADAE